MKYATFFVALLAIMVLYIISSCGCDMNRNSNGVSGDSGHGKWSVKVDNSLGLRLCENSPVVDEYGNTHNVGVGLENQNALTMLYRFRDPKTRFDTIRVAFTFVDDKQALVSNTLDMFHFDDDIYFACESKLSGAVCARMIKYNNTPMRATVYELRSKGRRYNSQVFCVDFDVSRTAEAVFDIDSDTTKANLQDVF